MTSLHESSPEQLGAAIKRDLSDLRRLDTFYCQLRRCSRTLAAVVVMEQVRCLYVMGGTSSWRQREVEKNLAAAARHRADLDLLQKPGKQAEYLQKLISHHELSAAEFADLEVPPWATVLPELSSRATSSVTSVTAPCPRCGKPARLNITDTGKVSCTALT